MQPPKVREVIRRLEADGWVLDRIEGSHRQYVHPFKRGTVTVAGKPNTHLSWKSWSSIQEQAGWK